jgi:hypothetical protein
MKKTIRSIFLVFALLSVVLSGCSPASTPVLSTIAPTVTLTPAPKNLAVANDLHVWIDDYVNACGGIVTVDGVERDANQLLEAVKANPGSFIERKTIKGRETLFFVVNGVPLGIQTDGPWSSILARDIADAKKRPVRHARIILSNLQPKLCYRC